MNNAELKRTNKPRKRKIWKTITAKAYRKRQNYLKLKERKAKEFKASLYGNVCNIQYENEKDLGHCVQNHPPPIKTEIEIKSEVPSDDEEVEEIKVTDPLSIDPLQIENFNSFNLISVRKDLQIQPPLSTDTSDLQNHEKPLKCTQCNKTYKNKKSFENHMNFHKPINPFTCPYCFKPFSTESSLMNHKKLYCQKLKTDEQEEQGLGFLHGSIRFDTEEVVDEQVENIYLEQSPQFIEEIHKEDYNEEDDLNTYKLKKLPTAEYKCTKCEERFSVAFLLKRHYQSHENNKHLHG